MAGPLEAALLDAELDAALDIAGRGSGEAALVLGTGEELRLLVDEEEADVTAEVDPDADGDSTILGTSIVVLPEGVDNIKVVVRVRPPNAREASAPSREIVRTDATTKTVHLLAEPPRSFTFDGVFGESATQEEVFRLVAGVGESCLSGYNGSIYVYGQTGSGKTYTMQGPVASVQSMHMDERRGIMCRILDLIFAELDRRRMEGGGVEYRCKCSYLEIYKEQITDLLEPGSSNLLIREDMNRGVFVERLTEHSVWTLSDAFHVLWKGLHQRHVGATQMNELSSRSHAVFTLLLESSSTAEGGVTSTRVARLNLIDLAGSERQSYESHGGPGAVHDGLRVKEAGAINKSLSALTNVIMSLSRAGQRRRSSVGGAGGNDRGGSSRRQQQSFVRYRDSKLTFLLRDSLGGNSKTVIVANASPSALCFGETLSTLKFAARAKHIRCTAVLNEEYSGTVESLSMEVKSLKQQLELLSSRGLISSDSGLPSQVSLSELHGSPAARAKVQAEKESEEDELMENLLAHGCEDLRRLYGPRRVRRLEILLAAALERERRCDLRRHTLGKFTQYLTGLIERKERYFDSLRDHYTLLVDRALGEACYPSDLSERLVRFRQRVSSVPTDARSLATEPGSPLRGTPSAAEFAGSMDQAGDTSAVRGGGSTSAARGGLWGSSGTASAPASAMGNQAARRTNRRGSGTSQSLQRSPSGRSIPSVTPGSGTSMGTSSGDVQAAGGADEEVAPLRAENRLLRRQLENHPELHRLAIENRMLQEHLSSLVQQHALSREVLSWSTQPHGTIVDGKSLGGLGIGSGTAEASHVGGSSAFGEDLTSQDMRRAKGGGKDFQGPGLTRDRSLTRTSRSSFLGLPSTTSLAVSGSNVLGGSGLASVSLAEENGDSSVSPPKTTLSQALSKAIVSSPVDGEKRSATPLTMRPFPGMEATQISPNSSSAGSDTDDSDHAAPILDDDPSVALLHAPLAFIDDALCETGTSGVVSDPTSFLPTLARQVEELFCEKSRLEDILKQLVRNTQPGDSVDEGIRGQLDLGQSPEPRGVPSADLEPRIANELLRSASEALALAEGISEGKGDALLLSPGGLGNDGEEGDFAEGGGDMDVFSSLMRSLPNESPHLQRRQRLACSAPHLSAAMSGGTSSMLRGHRAPQISPLRSPSVASSAPGLVGGHGLLRNKSMMALHRIVEAPVSPAHSADDLGATSPIIVSSGGGASATATTFASDANTVEEVLGEAGNKVRLLHRNLEIVADAYRDVRDQLRPLREEYDRKLMECRFLEVQCRRLDVHCRLLEERAVAAGLMDSPTRPFPQDRDGACASSLPASGGRERAVVTPASSSMTSAARPNARPKQASVGGKQSASRRQVPASDSSSSAASAKGSPLSSRTRSANSSRLGTPASPTTASAAMLATPPGNGGSSRSESSRIGTPIGGVSSLGNGNLPSSPAVNFSPVASPSSPTSAVGADGYRPWAWGAGVEHAASGSDGGGRGTGANVGVPSGAPTSGTGALISPETGSPSKIGSAAAGLGATKVPPRGLLYAASVADLRLDGSQRHQNHSIGGSSGSGGGSAPNSTYPEEYIRRVASAPLLPPADLRSAVGAAANLALERSVPSAAHHEDPRSPALTSTASATRLHVLGLGSMASTAGSTPIGVPNRGAYSARGPSSGVQRSFGGIGIGSSSARSAAPSSATVEDALPHSGGGIGDTAFSSSTFLSLARQPGATTAALQYLMSSTCNALTPVSAEQHEPASPKKHMASPQTRSALAGTSSARAALPQSLSQTGLTATTVRSTTSHGLATKSLLGSVAAQSAQALHRTGKGTASSPVATAHPGPGRPGGGAAAGLGQFRSSFGSSNSAPHVGSQAGAQQGSQQAGPSSVRTAATAFTTTSAQQAAFGPRRAGGAGSGSNGGASARGS